MAKKLKGYQVRVVSPGEKIKFDDLTCEAIPAYSLGFPSHPKSHGNVGYILTVNRMRIYHAGDTDLVEPLKALKNIDVALVPIDGGNLTMKTSEAAELINIIKPRMVIPIHYVIDKNNTKAFVDLLDEGIEVTCFTK